MKRILFLLSLIIFTQSIFAKNSALLIGIGNYNTEDTGWNRIHGNNDVDLLEGKLKDNGFTVMTIKDDKATKKNIEDALKKLVSSTNAGDNVYLHFSGHGQLIEDMNNDEQDELDQSFVCYDACFSPQYKMGGQSYKGQNHLIDDELFPYLNQLKTKVGSSGLVTVVFDSCYSGGADRGELNDDADPDSEVEWVDTTRGAFDEFQVNKSAASYLRSIKTPGNYKAGGGIVLVLSACESDKKNYECKEKHTGKFYGSLSYCISKLIDNNIPMNQWEDYFANKKYKELKIFRTTQRPVVESHK